MQIEDGEQLHILRIPLCISLVIKDLPLPSLGVSATHCRTHGSKSTTCSDFPVRNHRKFCLIVDTWGWYVGGGTTPGEPGDGDGDGDVSGDVDGEGDDDGDGDGTNCSFSCPQAAAVPMESWNTTTWPKAAAYVTLSKSSLMVIVLASATHTLPAGTPGRIPPGEAHAVPSWMYHVPNSRSMFVKYPVIRIPCPSATTVSVPCNADVPLQVDT